MKEISDRRDGFGINSKMVELMEEFVKDATPYPKNLSREELENKMRENGAENFEAVGNILFAVDEHGICTEGFKLSVRDFYLKCYNNRMFGIFKKDE